MSKVSQVDDLLGSQRLLICVGPGGVGKTTVAAAMGLRAALMGRRALVLTIDPAKRLADALGLDGLDDRIREVSTAALQEEGVEVSGSLHAAMFDNADSMDSLMARIAPSPEARDRILENRVYRAMAGTLARSHAYLAMERLHEVMEGGDYDLVILDTPPARNALDILDAPGRLASFLEEGVVKWFVRGKDARGIRARLLQGGGAAATKLFGMIAGKQFLEELIAFFEAFYELRHGFRERAARVNEIMAEPSSSFVLVSSTDTTHLEDALAMGISVRERGVSIDSVVFNRSYEPLVGDSLTIVEEVEGRDLQAALVDLWPKGAPEGALALLRELESTQRRAAQANFSGMRASEAMLASLEVEAPPVYVARVEGEVCDLAGLAALIPYLAHARS